MGLRRIRLLTAATAIALMAGLAGCTPTPEPTPTPTALFSSEEEAFKAAEETYRAYVEAENAKRAGDEAADPQALLTGLALKNFIETQPERTGETNRAFGAFVILSFEPTEGAITSSSTSVSANSCVDASAIRIEDANGTDVTPSDIPQRISQELEFTQVGSTLLISYEGPGDKPCL